LFLTDFSTSRGLFTLECQCSDAWPASFATLVVNKTKILVEKGYSKSIKSHIVEKARLWNKCWNAEKQLSTYLMTGWSDQCTVPQLKAIILPTSSTSIYTVN